MLLLRAVREIESEHVDPASMSAATASGLRDAGPMVAMILV